MGSGREYRQLGEEASERFLKEGEGLNQAIQKLADENNLNPHEVQRVVEHANVNSFLSQFKQADDKAEVAFDVADSDAIDPPAEPSGKESSVDDLTDYMEPPERSRGDATEQKAAQRVKKAQASRSQGRTKEEWVAHLKEAGVPQESIERFESDWDEQVRCGRSRGEAEKVAMRHVPDFALDDPTGPSEQDESEKFAFDQSWANDYFDGKDLSTKEARIRAHQKLSAARQALQEDLEDLRIHGKNRVGELAKKAEDAMKEGVTLDLLKEASDRLDLSPEARNLVDQALEKASERKLDIAEYREQYDVELETKTAAVNDEHPFVQKMESLNDWADSVQEKQAEIKRLHTAIETIEQYDGI